MVYINNHKYGVAPVTQSKQEAKVEAYANALAYARKIHYTIKVSIEWLHLALGEKIDEKSFLQQKEIVDTVEVACQDKYDESGNAPMKVEKKNQICADNKGFQMMKMLGWTGGALGTSGDGIQEPVRYVHPVQLNPIRFWIDRFWNYSPTAWKWKSIVVDSGYRPNPANWITITFTNT